MFRFFQVFKIAEAREVSEASPFCLSGTGEMGLAGFCADRVFGSSLGTEAEFFSTVSRCYRHEVAQQEPLLYRTHQFSKVSCLSCLNYKKVPCVSVILVKCFSVMSEVMCSILISVHLILD